MNIGYFDSPIGLLKISENGSALCKIEFAKNKSIPVNSTELLEKIKKQLSEYFNGIRREFDLPLAPSGTDFQKRVWRELCRIPYGETRCYSEIAAAIGNSNAQRAVGLANNKNPIPIVIPCHRVIGKNGNLVGYAGGLDIKQKLLELEKA